MKINFTKKQFRLLLDIVYLGEMVINGWKLPDERLEKYSEIQQYIYSFAEKFGMENLVEYNGEFAMYFETTEYEDSGIHELMDEYENEVFWEDLSLNLARRDVYKSHEQNKEVVKENLIKEIWAREEKYKEEFYKNGLDNVKIDV